MPNSILIKNLLSFRNKANGKLKKLNKRLVEFLDRLSLFMTKIIMEESNTIIIFQLF